MLELRVLLAQLPELTQFAQTQSRILLLPDVVRRLADPVLAADLGHPGAALRLPQCPQDLLLRMSLLRHLRVLLVLVQRTTLAASNSTCPWLAFRVLGHGRRRRGLPGVRELLRGAVAKCAVRTDLVVVLPPALELVARVGNAEEDLYVQTLVTQPAVERLDVSVLGRPARPDKVQLNSVLVCPYVHRLALKLGAIVDRDRDRRAALGDDLRQRQRNLLAR